MSWLFKSNSPYIREKQKELVRAHRYQGECLSYSYHLFYSPICDIFVKVMPRWVAPNLISVIGFLCNFLPHVLIALLFGSDMYGNVPAWFNILLGVAFFIYMVCDNSDGKQARRTGTSSPLGMLLDHGMDSVTAVINNFILQRVLQIGNCYLSLFGLLVSTMPFYFAVLEQYYTGELVLQVVNGVDDGSFGYIGLCFLTAYLGCDFWKVEYSFLGYPPTQLSHILLYVLFAVLSLSTLDYVKNIYVKRHSKQFKAVYQLPYLISHALWYFLNAAVFLTAASHSPEDIMTTNPRRVMYGFGFQFILMALRIQLSGVTQEKFNPFRRTTIITWAVLIAHIIHVRMFGVSFMNEACIYLLIDVLSFGALAHFILNVQYELKTILGINLLSLTQKQLAAQPELERREKEAQAEEKLKKQ